MTKSLEHITKGIRLLNVKEISEGDNHVKTRAIVYVPNGKEGYFISKIRQYKEEETSRGNPKNSNLVNSIEDVTIALLEGLWTSGQNLIPTDVANWCEAWLNIDVKKQNQNNYQILN